MSGSQLDEEAIFSVARRIDVPEARVEYLHQACGDDQVLFDRVSRLLRVYTEESGFLESPLITGGDTAAAILAAVPEMPGTVIGPYKLLEQIGEGGMGLVFMAEQQRPMRRLVALKIIKPGMDTRQVIARFEAERQALALMEHPHIARVLDAGATDSGRPYFVMELVRGIPVTEYCDQSRLPMRERLQLFISICEAVQHAHQKGIIHRDIKPSNILVTMHDDKAVPKVIDFGVAKATNQRLVEQTLFTNFAQLIGTPTYMSPEQAQMSGLDVDTRSDVYSLGVLLYELLTGTTPFDKETFSKVGYDEMLRMIRDDEPPRPSHRVATLVVGRLSTISENRRLDPRRLTHTLRSDVDWIVMKALEKDRTRRYASADAFAADLRRYLGDEAVEACPPSAVYRLKKLVKRNKAMLGTAAALLGVIVVVCGVAASITYRQLRIAQELGEEKTELALSERRLRTDSNRQLAYSLFDQSYSKCSADDAAAGLLWLTRSLQRTRELGVTELERPIRRQIAGWSRYVPPVRMTFSHSEPVTAVAFSPEGRTAMTVCADHHARLWDVETGDLRCPPLEHAGAIHAAAFSPSGLKLATACADQTARLWNVQTGQQIGGSMMHAGEVRAIAFSPSGNSLITRSDDLTAKLWNSETLEQIGPPLQHQSAVTFVAFSPDGTKAITANFDGTAQLWDAATGRLLDASFQHVAVAPESTVALSVATMSPDGKVVLTASLDHTARTWSADTGEPLGPPLPHSNWVELAEFSPDGRFVVTGSDNKSARVWETATGKPIGQPLQHNALVTSAHFSPDGKVLLTASLDWKLRLWDAATTQPLGSAMNCEAGIRSAVFSSDGQAILTGDDGGFARIWDISLLLPPKKTPVETGEAGYLAVSPRGDVVLTAGFLQAQLRDADAFRPLGHPINYKPEFKDRIRMAAFSRDGRSIIIATTDGRTRLWSAETGEPLAPPLEHPGNVFAVAFTPDGKTFATGGMDRCVRLWDVKTQQPAGEPFPIPSVICAVAISPDGKTLLAGCQDGYVRRWDLASRAPVEPALRHDGEVWSLGFSADGRTIVTGSYDHTARLWDASSGSPLGLPLDHGEFAVTRAQLSPDGETLFTATGEGEAVLWNLAVRRPFGMPKVLSTIDAAICFTPDGKRVLVSGPDDNIRSWDVPQPITGDVEQVAMWATVLTAMELDATDTVRPLDGSTWLTRHRRLRQLDVAPQTAP